MTVTTRTIPEWEDAPYRTGRHVKHDDRSRNHPADLAEVVADVLHTSTGLPLNQGQLGKCTAEALCGRLNTVPTESKFVATDHDSDTLYGRETADEGTPWPPNDPGGSGLAVCQAARELGWIKSYGHTFSFSNALLGVTKRPAIVGVNWYESMFTPDANGVVSISPNSSIAGGHEILWVQINIEAQMLGFWNSWGYGWGKGGMFYMTYATLERLLSEQGDVTFPYT